MAQLPLQNQDAAGSNSEKYPGAPENTVIEAEVLEAKIEDSRWDDEHNPGQKKKQVSFKFRALEGEFEDRWFWGRVSAWFSTSPTCKLRQWVQALLDVDVLPADFVLDTDHLVGLQGRIIIGAKTRDDGSVANWVNEVRPSRGLGANGASTAPEQPAGIPLAVDQPF